MTTPIPTAVPAMVLANAKQFLARAHRREADLLQEARSYQEAAHANAKHARDLMADYEAATRHVAEVRAWVEANDTVTEAE